MQRISVRGNIKLDQFLKWAGVASSGGQGKLLIQSGKVKVNGEPEVSRGKIIQPGDMVHIEGLGDFLVIKEINCSDLGDR